MISPWKYSKWLILLPKTFLNLLFSFSENFSMFYFRSRKKNWWNSSYIRKKSPLTLRTVKRSSANFSIKSVLANFLFIFFFRKFIFRHWISFDWVHFKTKEREKICKAFFLVDTITWTQRKIKIVQCYKFKKITIIVSSLMTFILPTFHWMNK